MILKKNALGVVVSAMTMTAGGLLMTGALAALPAQSALAQETATTTCAAAWNAMSAYNGGATVSENNINYSANWWTQGDDPATHSGAGGSGQPWTVQGACGDAAPAPAPTPAPSPAPTPSPAPAPAPTPAPAPPPADPPSPPPASSNPDEKCRPDGLYETPGVAVPYCTVYDDNGREILPNGLHRRIVGYFASWRTGKDGTPAYLVDQIPWNKLSGINYAFAHIGPDGKVSVNENVAGNAATQMTWPNDPGAAMDPLLPYKGAFNLLTKFKQAHPGVKTFISIGGWAETGGYIDGNGNRVASGGFYTMTQSQASIDKFADSVVAFMRKYGFDGADIDYEYPTSNSKAGNPDDFAISEKMRGQLWAGYLDLMKTLRQKLDKASAEDGHYYMLTSAVPGSGWLLRGEEVYQAARYLDVVNIMSYDLHGAWNDYVAGLAPLYDNGKDPELASAGVYRAYKGMGYLNVDWAYHYFRGSMPGDRINIGVPFYTRGWTGVTGGTNGMNGRAPLADQNDCPPGTGTKIGSTTPCGAGAVGIDNIWHDSNAAGDEVPSGVNPIWQLENLQHGIRGSYLASYGVPASAKIVGTYEHHFDPLTKTEWWWNPTTRTFLTGDADQAIEAKADYVANNEAGGIMIWELAGDYAYKNGEYQIGDTLINEIYQRFTKASDAGASTAAPGETMPTKAIPLDVTLSDFALGDNNYPINPKLTITNNSSEAIPYGSTITFDYATTTPPIMSEQGGWGLTLVKAGQTGANIGGIKGDFNTVSLKIPRGGIASGASAWTKLSWLLPITQISNVRVTIDGVTYGTSYNRARGVTLVEPGNGDGGDGGNTPPTGQCSGSAWDAGSVYTGGDKVTSGGHDWTAKWWNKGDEPGSSQWGPWTDDGACASN